MNRHRPRRPRQDGASLRYLAQWRAHIERLEARAGRGVSNRVGTAWEFSAPTGCPACDGELTDDSRARLEGLVRNGGRRAHRLSVEVARLDERYRDVTKETEAPTAVPWWNRRVPYR